VPIKADFIEMFYFRLPEIQSWCISMPTRVMYGTLWYQKE